MSSSLYPLFPQNDAAISRWGELFTAQHVDDAGGPQNAPARDLTGRADTDIADHDGATRDGMLPEDIEWLTPHPSAQET